MFFCCHQIFIEHLLCARCANCFMWGILLNYQKISEVVWERLGNLSKIIQVVNGIVRSSIIQVNLTPKPTLLAFVPVLTNRNLMWAINVSYMCNLNISDSQRYFLKSEKKGWNEFLKSKKKGGGEMNFNNILNIAKILWQHLVNIKIIDIFW